MEASEEEWLNPRNYYGDNRTLCNHSSALIFYVVDPLCLGGLHMILLRSNLYPVIHKKYIFYVVISICIAGLLLIEKYC